MVSVRIIFDANDQDKVIVFNTPRIAVLASNVTANITANKASVR